MLAAGWRLIAKRTARFPPDRPDYGCLRGIDHFGDVAQTNRSALVAGDDEGLILVSLEKLVGIEDSPGLRGIESAPFARFALAAWSDLRTCSS